MNDHLMGKVLRLCLSCACAFALVTLALPGTAFAGNQTISFVSGNGTSDPFFSPTTVTIAPSELVTWQSASTSFASHPLVSEDGLWTTPSSGRSLTHTFPTVGSFRFYCQNHGGPGGVGMSGTVVVTTTPPPDTVAPTIKVPTVASTDLAKIEKRRKLTIAVATSEAATIAVTVDVKSPRSGKYVRFGSGTITVDDAHGDAAKLAVSLKSHVLRAFRTRTRARVRITLLTTDAAGNSSTRSLVILLRR